MLVNIVTLRNSTYDTLNTSGEQDHETYDDCDILNNLPEDAESVNLVDLPTVYDSRLLLNWSSRYFKTTTEGYINFFALNKAN